MKPASLRSVLRKLSTDEAVDWDAAESAADASARGLLRELHVIANISAAHQAAAAGDVTASRVLPFTRSEETIDPNVNHWGHLVLRERIAHGADGDVYRAFDNRLQREVALKLVRDGHAQPQVSRFLNEARLLARVRHANVVTVYGADVVGGKPGIWMELIAGATLQQVVSRQGSFGAQEAALIGAEVCRAIAAIHQAGILHRDIKAQNVMREAGGRIVLMDFSVSDADSKRSGLAGTPVYLAPELLAGQRATLQSDVYSVGVLLYYLVTGTYPVAGTTVADLARAHEQGLRKRLRDARADLPSTFISAVDRALATDPAARPASAGELEDLLMQSLPGQAAGRDTDRVPARSGTRRWPLVAAATFSLMIGGMAIARWPLINGPAPAPIALEARPWIMVAAFDNRTPDRELDGVLEYALERELVSSAQVRVASRARVDDALRLMRRPLDTALDPATAREVALRDGNIRTLIEGRIERVGTVTVLTASLVDVHGGATLASVVEEVQANGELPQAVRRLSRRLRGALGEAARAISLTTRQLERVTTPSLKALRLYSEAYAAGERDNWPASMALAGQAIDEDNTFAAAHTWLAWSMFRNRQATDAVVAEASRGMSLARTASDWERMWITASYYQLNGEEDRAVPAYEALVRLYPDHFWGVNNLVRQYQRLGRDAEAVALAEHLVELRPHDYDALYVALDQLQRTGNLERAKEYAARIRATGVYDRDPSGDAWLFDAFAAWHGSDPALSMRELAKAQTEAMSLDRELRDAILRRASMLWLALGRPSNARDTVALALPGAESHLIQATIAEASGDLPLARRETLNARPAELNGVRPTFPDLNKWVLALWLFRSSGAISDSAAFFATVRPIAGRLENPDATAISKVLAAEAAIARGAFDDAIQSMQELRWDVLGPRTMFLAKEALADALASNGKPDAAVEVLRSVTAVRHHAAYDRAFWWIRCQLRLAELHAQLGHTSEAQIVARELEAMLREAEPGFPMIERVRALLSPAR